MTNQQGNWPNKLLINGCKRYNSDWKPPNFLHHFDMATCEALLRKVRAALADSGRALTLEFVPNEDRISPPEAAGFSMMMLGGTPSGDAYTFAELERMFSNAGFARTREPPVVEERIFAAMFRIFRFRSAFSSISPESRNLLCLSCGGISSAAQFNLTPPF